MTTDEEEGTLKIVEGTSTPSTSEENLSKFPITEVEPLPGSSRGKSFTINLKRVKGDKFKIQKSPSKTKGMRKMFSSMNLFSKKTVEEDEEDKESDGTEGTQDTNETEEEDGDVEEVLTTPQILDENILKASMEKIPNDKVLDQRYWNERKKLIFDFYRTAYRFCAVKGCIKKFARRIIALRHLKNVHKIDKNEVKFGKLFGAEKRPKNFKRI